MFELLLLEWTTLEAGSEVLERSMVEVTGTEFRGVELDE